MSEDYDQINYNHHGVAEYRGRQANYIKEKQKLDAQKSSFSIIVKYNFILGCYEIQYQNLFNCILAQDPQYIALLNMLQVHNIKVRQCNVTHQVHYDMQISCAFHEKLQQLMNKLLSFEKSIQQSNFLSDIFKWAQRAKQYGFAPNIVNKQATMIQENIVNDEDISQATTKLSSSVLPSEMIRKEKSVYLKGGGRTWHHGIEPSKERLESYKYRKLVPNQTFFHEKEKQNDFLSTKMTFPTFYNKTFFKLDTKDELDSQKRLPDDEFNDIIQEINQDNSKILDESIQDQVQNIIVSIAPKKKCYTKDMIRDVSVSNRSKSFEIGSQFNFYDPGTSNAEAQMEKMWFKNNHRELQKNREDQEMINHVVQWSKNKSRVEKEIHRRIDSRIRGSQYDKMFQNQIPKKDQSAERLYSQKQIVPKQIGNPSEDSLHSNEEMIKIINSKEGTPKHDEENQYIASDFLPPSGTQINILPKNIQRGRSRSIKNPRFIDLSSTLLNRSREDNPKLQISTARVRNIIQMNKDLLNLELNRTSQSILPINQKSFSVYAEQRDGLTSQSFFLMTREKEEKIFNDQLQEAKSIKERLAKYRIFVPTNKIINSIVTPMLLKKKTINSLNQSRLDSENELPEPGYGLSENPFQEVEKKKSKRHKN